MAKKNMIWLDESLSSLPKNQIDRLNSDELGVDRLQVLLNKKPEWFKFLSNSNIEKVVSGENGKTFITESNLEKGFKAMSKRQQESNLNFFVAKNENLAKRVLEIRKDARNFDENTAKSILNYQRDGKGNFAVINTKKLSESNLSKALSITNNNLSYIYLAKTNIKKLPSSNLNAFIKNNLGKEQISQNGSKFVSEDARKAIQSIPKKIYKTNIETIVKTNPDLLYKIQRNGDFSKKLNFDRTYNKDDKDNAISAALTAALSMRDKTTEEINIDKFDAISEKLNKNFTSSVYKNVLENVIKKDKEVVDVFVGNDVSRAAFEKFKKTEGVEIATTIVVNNGPIKFIPSKFLTSKVIYAAIKSNPENISEFTRIKNISLITCVNACIASKDKTSFLETLLKNEVKNRDGDNITFNNKQIEFVKNKILKNIQRNPSTILGMSDSLLELLAEKGTDLTKLRIKQLNMSSEKQIGAIVDQLSLKQLVELGKNANQIKNESVVTIMKDSIQSRIDNNTQNATSVKKGVELYSKIIEAENNKLSASSKTEEVLNQMIKNQNAINLKTESINSINKKIKESLIDKKIKALNKKIEKTNEERAALLDENLKLDEQKEIEKAAFEEASNKESELKNQFNNICLSADEKEIIKSAVIDGKGDELSAQTDKTAYENNVEAEIIISNINRGKKMSEEKFEKAVNIVKSKDEMFKNLDTELEMAMK